MTESLERVLFAEDEPDQTQHIYFKRGNETFDLTYLQSIPKGSEVAGTEYDAIREASESTGYPAYTILEMLHTYQRIVWQKT